MRSGQELIKIHVKMVTFYKSMYDQFCALVA
jgi:hypothetical protein